MRSSRRRLIAIVLGAVLVHACGCKREPPVEEEPPTPDPGVVTLRVVMFVEAGADLDFPPLETGGCKLTRTQVTDLVDELTGFQQNFCPGLTLEWDRNIDKLESTCLEVLPPPFPSCFSQCSLTGVPDNCPRKLPAAWFVTYVVNHPAGGPLALLPPGDSYIHDVQGPDDRTLNIYFVGNIMIAPGEFDTGFTLPPNTMGVDFVLINDLALTDPFAPADLNLLQARRVLLHEVCCHWLKITSTHPDVPPGECPENLCVSGQVATSCGNMRSGKVTDSDQSAICTRLTGGPWP